MKRLLLLVIVLLAGFYIAWPAWTGWTIKTAIDAKDARALERGIDFPSVRESLRPAATAEVTKIFDTYQKQAGPTGALIASQVKGDVIPKIVESSLATMVTPENVIRIVTEGVPLKESLDRIIREQIGRVGGIQIPGMTGGSATPGQKGGLGNLGDIAGKMGIDPGKILGGLGGKPAPNPVQTVDDKPKQTGEPPAGQAGMGLANVKSFSFSGPLAFRVGLAKDAAQAAPDVEVEMGFKGAGWMVTGVYPRL